MKEDASKNTTKEELKKLAYRASVTHAIVPVIGELSRAAVTFAADLKCLPMDPTPERPAAMQRAYTKMGDELTELEFIVAKPPEVRQ